jgi:hypothetical protein
LHLLLQEHTVALSYVIGIWHFYTEPPNVEIVVLVVAETYCNIKSNFE